MTSSSAIARFKRTSPHPGRGFLKATWLSVAFVIVAPQLSARDRAAEESEVIIPRQVISLFDGKSLEDFYTWIPASKYEDPDCVFSIVDAVDGAPAIRISGQHWGSLVTKRRYADYKLVVEYRWGIPVWGKRKLLARDSGILFHVTGKDGNRYPNFDGPWMQSVEYQIIEGGTGDIILVPGHQPGTGERILTRLTARVAPGTSRWDPAGEPKVFDSGRIDWQFRDPNRKNELNFRGARDVEHPYGQWNRIELVARRADVIHYLNGVKVNEGINCSLTEGKILVQSEGAEIYVRKFELHPLPGP